MNELPFDTTFQALTENPPFPWQRALYERFISDRIDNIPESCNLPTGLGKTSVIAVWLIALANGKPVPRRLVYVVNRRTVVDQTTDEVEKYKSNKVAGIPDFAISTLRGQYADNREWSADPARPAVICGTVDMIGSRLLFSGYGLGFKSRPLHAGFLGQDSLLVHDEAHLEPAFQDLLIAIEKEQKRCKEFGSFRVMELSATSRFKGEVFTLSDKDRAEAEVQKRIGAKKAIHLHENKDEKKLADEIADLALGEHTKGWAVLVFVRKVDDVDKVVKKLPKDSYEQLTGTLRGKERDELVEKPIFRRFLPKAEPGSETVYLVCTSAGEVGVNISADHLVCDLSTFDSMAQRFGRVNRFGDRDDTRIDIVHPTAFDEKDDLESRRKKTLDLLVELKGNGSPNALNGLDEKARLDAFAPPPVILPVSDILFDAWALTTIRGKLPGRPIVEPYLHGLTDYDPPQTVVAWREEVERLTTDILVRNKLTPEDVLELYPLKPHEELSGTTYGKNKVFEQLEKVAARDAKREPEKRLSAWVIEPDDTVAVYSLEKLVERDKLNKPVMSLGGRTVLLPPSAGGLQGGLLTGEAEFADDVSDLWYQDKGRTLKRRIRLWDGNSLLEETRKVMRLVRRIDIPAPEDNEDAEGKSWYWYTRPNAADDDGSKTAKVPITWEHHTTDVETRAKKLADTLLAGHANLHQALVVAARFHDLGKKRVVWQKSIGNPNPKYWLAKSGGKMKPRELTDFRHEFGSLIDLADPERTFKVVLDGEPEEVRELVLHLIATHHGYGRPHFPTDNAFDPEGSQERADKAAREVPRRFARLQRKFGRWGLAYLESLLRAADWAASASPSEYLKEGE